MTSNLRTPRPAPDQWNPTWRSIATVLLVIHFCCIFVVLSSNNDRSPLQARLVQVFSIYTQFFNFDPNFTPYALIVQEQPDDCFLVFDLYEDSEKAASQQPLLKTVSLPDRGSKLLDSQKRYFALSRLVAINANPEGPNDDANGEIARAVSGRIMRENGARRCIFRCVRKRSQPMDLEQLLPGLPRDNPTSAAYDMTLYEADVWFDEDDQLQAIKRSAQNEVAPRQGGS